MRLLLDTHVFLWYLTGAKALSVDLRKTIQHPGNAVFLSPVSIWEALVKFATVDPAVRAYPVPSC